MNVHKHTHMCDSLLHLRDSPFQLRLPRSPLCKSTHFSMTPFDGGGVLIVASGIETKQSRDLKRLHEDEGTERSEGENRRRADGQMDGWNEPGKGS